MTWMIYRIRPTNRTVYDDLESRRRTAVNSQTAHTEGRYQGVASQENYKGNFVPKRDSTR